MLGILFMYIENLGTSFSSNHLVYLYTTPLQYYTKAVVALCIEEVSTVCSNQDLLMIYPRLISHGYSVF